ncbi:transposase domain-containing protein [Caballeronia sordidicola]|uniref:transposase domain-containing protein n=1 Tax=Caballeronia sordidicola TaxID=196367 RepID=UPI0015C5044D
MYSLIGTARLNGIEPYAWLERTLEKLPSYSVNRVYELLPLARYNTSTPWTFSTRFGRCCWKPLKRLGVGRMEGYRFPSNSTRSRHPMHDRS